MSKPHVKLPGDRGSALTLRTVLSTWWPLAASWLLMGIEMPIGVAVIGRLADPEIQLAAFGGVIFPMSLIIESPVIMLLAASVALSDSPRNFKFLQRFSRILGISFTGIHGLIAFTPLFDILVIPLIDPPEEVIEPARLGFQCMLPFTWAVAERRFHQGLLIRFGYQRKIGVGTLVRLLGMTGTILTLALLADRFKLQGAMIGSMAISVGVILEAIYVRAIALKVERGPLLAVDPDTPDIDLRRTLTFYIPLAMTSVIGLASQPIGSAGINRMPDALLSLAVWPALGGLGFLLRSTGIAFNEVVIRHAGDPESRVILRRFALVGGGILSLLTILFAIAPFAKIWFQDIEGLDSEMFDLAQRAVWMMLPGPFFAFLASYWQGLLVNAHQTRAISEGVAVGLSITTIVLIVLSIVDTVPGAIGASLAMSLGQGTQCLWLWARVRRLVPKN